MDQRQSKQSICNANGIRIYPVNVNGYYKLEVEYNRTSDFDPRYRRKVQRGDIRYDPKKNEWVEKLYELYEKLYQDKLKSKLEKNEKSIQNHQRIAS